MSTSTTTGRRIMLLLLCAMAAVATYARTDRFDIKDAEGVAPWKVSFKKDAMLAPGVTGLVARTVYDVPADWEGKFVRFEIPFCLLNMDAVLFLDGERIGDILRPEGWLDVSRRLKYGSKNEVALYCTFTGEGTDYGKCPLNYDMRRVNAFRATVTPRFAVSDGPAISDVFANTSWRRKRLRCEVGVLADEKTGSEVEDSADADAALSVMVKDQEGTTVRTAEKRVALKGGTNHFDVDIPWEDPVCWELGHPYLYTAVVELKKSAAGSAGSGLPADTHTVRFGFRETWRDGRELMMNGHKLHLRTHYGFGVNSKASALFMRQIGYNLATFNHATEPEGNFDDGAAKAADDFDEIGYGAFYSCGGLPALCGWNFRTDERRRDYVKRFAQSYHRRTRNHPSVLGAYVAQMIVCDIKFGPDEIAQSSGTTDRHKLIDYVCDFHRQFNPNILYYSHADGSCGDIASGNMYLNWTPLQERIEWLNQWAEKGVYPWHGAEFGQPYGGCWYAPARLLCVSEQLARYFGVKAYEDEPLKYLEGAREKGDTNRSTHGGRRGAEYSDHPLYWELHRMWCWYTNSRWRGNGFNGGNNYFNLKDGYGTPPDGQGHVRYGAPSMVLDAGRRPTWVNADFDNFQLGNKDFLGYIGGMPVHTDRTHAYYAGEKVEKQMVMIWDGAGCKDVVVNWELRTADCRQTLLSGFAAATLPQGDIVKVPVSFTAPAVSAKRDCVLIASFMEGLDCLWTDSEAIEVYPAFKPGVRTPHGKAVALFDATGDGERLLKAIGVKYDKVGDLMDVDPATFAYSHLIVAKNSLGETGLDRLAPLVKKGLRILILPQLPGVWQSLGFDVQDEMSRQMWAYDKTPASPFRAISDDMLSYWRGAPKYGDRPTGAIMTHSGSRGPRGSRNHTVAGLCLRIPDKVGYLPLIAGEFDMQYAALLSFSAGRGGVWYCTLDFEDRIGICPAATETARTVFQSFFAAHNATPSSEEMPTELTLKAKKGFVTQDGRIYRAEPLPGLGNELFRWTCPVVAPCAPDGSFVLKSDQFRSQVPSADAARTNAAPAWAQMHVNRLFARVATQRGVQPSDDDVRRALYQSVEQPFVPFPAMHVCGPFAAGKDNTDYMMNTLWSGQVEEMAIAGDFNPNYDFPLPQGGSANWRPLVYPDEEGRFDVGGLYPGVSFPVAYLIAHVPREKAERVMMGFGVDWRAKIWINGVRISPIDGSTWDEANPPTDQFGKWGSAQSAKWRFPVDLKAGDNVIAFKIGAGRSDFKFWALISNEAKGAAARRERNEALEKMKLYGDLVPNQDPNTYTWW